MSEDSAAEEKFRGSRKSQSGLSEDVKKVSLGIFIGDEAGWLTDLRLTILLLRKGDGWLFEKSMTV